MIDLSIGGGGCRAIARKDYEQGLALVQVSNRLSRVEILIAHVYDGVLGRWTLYSGRDSCDQRELAMMRRMMVFCLFGNQRTAEVDAEVES